MHIFFGTVARAAPESQGGGVFKLDWESKSIIKEVPIVPTEPAIEKDPNARGNVRGVRGFAFGETMCMLPTTTPLMSLTMT